MIRMSIPCGITRSANLNLELTSLAYDSFLSNIALAVSLSVGCNVRSSDTLFCKLREITLDSNDQCGGVALLIT